MHTHLSLAHPALQLAVIVSFLGRSFAVGLIGLHVILMPDVVRMFYKFRSEVVLIITLSAVQRVSGPCMLSASSEGAAACFTSWTQRCLPSSTCDLMQSYIAADC